MRSEIVVVMTAFNEADQLEKTLSALGAAFPETGVVVADDASTDATAEVDRSENAEVVTAPRQLEKDGVATLAAERTRSAIASGSAPTLMLCDNDLGASAQHLPELVEAIERGDEQLTIAVFEKRVDNGFGLAVGFAHRAIRSLTELDLRTPISGQRALAPAVLNAVLPFAPRFGMEIGMTIDAHRTSFGVVEVELPLEHRATGRTAANFAHQAKQLRNFVHVYALQRMRKRER